MAVVSLVRSKITDESKIEEMVRTVLEPLGGVEGFVSKGDRVVLKPNLVTNRKYFTGATTDPLIVLALIHELKRIGVSDITVADGSWVGCPTERAFTATGLSGLCAREGVKLVNLQRDEYVSVKVSAGNELKGKVNIAKTVLDADKLINLPKLKAHAQTKLTLSLKNLKGCISDDEKRRFHRIDIDRAIAELNTVLSPDLIVLDGIVGEMTAELGCDPIRLDTIVAGTDPVALDALCATMMGYDPHEIEHIVHAEELGVGKGLDTSKIELKGDVELASIKGEIGDSVGFARYTESFQSYGLDIQESGACSSCLAALYLALKRVADDEKLEDLQGCSFYIGQNFAEDSDGSATPAGEGGSAYRIGIGNCTKALDGLDIFTKGCPPTALTVYRKLRRKF
ncbi:MAG: DUF362 domain-containing protein [Thermoplasmata archaeon]|nr:MAG: DUF362 domain-containing protein [Thermoplasmata archaeon]